MLPKIFWFLQFLNLYIAIVSFGAVEASELDAEHHFIRSIDRNGPQIKNATIEHQHRREKVSDRLG